MTTGSDADPARVTASGKLNLPARHRRLLGLEHGGPVVVRVEDGEIRIRAARAVLAELQDEARALFQGSGESVDAFLEERRAEAAREEAAAADVGKDEAGEGGAP